MPLNVAIYRRDDDDERHQLQACQAYATVRGWTVTARYTDGPKVSAADRDRPGYRAMIADRPTAIIVHELDRLTRSDDTMAELLALDVPIYAVHGLSLDTPARRDAMRAVLAWEAEHREARS